MRVLSALLLAVCTLSVAPGTHAADDADDTQAGASRGRPAPASGALKVGLDSARIEWGRFSPNDRADTTATAHVVPFALWRPSQAWEVRAGLRLEATRQWGGTTPYDDGDAELSDTYVRYRAGGSRLTAGMQTILWGRVDEVPLIDRVSRVDLTRFAIDRLPDRRRPLPALRWEQTFDAFSLDLVALPGYSGAQLPSIDSTWHPVNRQTGEIAGIAPNPGLAAFVRAADLRRDSTRSGGAAVRLTGGGDGWPDIGVTIARTRQSLPYFQAELAAGRLTEVHPYNRFVGMDLEYAGDGATWRSELSYTLDVPSTTAAGERVASKAVDWVGAVELFPGGGDVRVSLLLMAHRLRTPGPVLELSNYLAIGGDIETPLDQGRWKLGVRFNSGLNVHDVYVSPRVVFAGWEPHEFYAAYHHFSGAAGTLGGFYQANGMLAVGLKTRF